MENMKKIFKESSCPAAIKLHLTELKFSLLNNYHRKYFLSADRKFRITIDTGMQVYRIGPWGNLFLHRGKDHNNVIMELKYNKSQDRFVDEITNFFPFRMTRSSKYVEGIARLGLN